MDSTIFRAIQPPLLGHVASPLRVAVLYGGHSAERAVSLESGRTVAQALAAAGHEVALFDTADVPWTEWPWQRVDVAYIALHGGAGEDGRVQAALEQLDIPYTGSGPAASRLAMSKSASKERFAAAGVPTPDYALVHRDDSPPQIVARARHLGGRLVVKPDSQGSSLGVGLAERPRDVPPLLAASAALDEFVLLERYVAGRELTVALLGREVLPVVEIAAPGGWFDYDAKYRSPRTIVCCPADLPADREKSVRDVALAAAECLDTRGLVRVDVRLDHRGQPWVLEVNTVPGMTDHSLAPRAAAAAGIDLPALCDRQVYEALSVGAGG